MTTQKQTLQGYFKYDLDKDFKIIAIADWLENINWHKECAMLIDQYIYEGRVKYVNVIKQLHMAMSPLNYSASYVRDLIKCSLPLQQIRQTLTFTDAPIIEYRGYSIHRDEIRDYDSSTKITWALSTVYGFGLDDSWSNFQGQAFINELATALNLKQVKKPDLIDEAELDKVLARQSK